MLEEKINVMPLRVILTKTGKTLLTYAVDETSSEKLKGMLVLEQWFQSEVPFKNIDLDLIGKKLYGTYEYKKTFNGQAKMQLTHLFDDNGVDLLA